MGVGHICARRVPEPWKLGRSNRPAKNALGRTQKDRQGGRRNLPKHHQLGRSPAGGCTEERGNSGNTNEDGGRGRVFATTPTALRARSTTDFGDFGARANWRRRRHRATSRNATSRLTIEEFRRDSAHTRRDEGARQATTRRHVASPVARRNRFPGAEKSWQAISEVNS